MAHGMFLCTVIFYKILYNYMYSLVNINIVPRKHFSESAIHACTLRVGSGTTMIINEN